MGDIYLSGNIGGAGNLTICAGCADRFQRIVINIPPHKKLRIKKVMFYISAAENLRLQIENHPYGDYWVSAGSQGVESPDYVIWENISDTPFQLGISVLIRNMDSAPHSLLPESGWSIILSKG